MYDNLPRGFKLQMQEMLGERFDSFMESMTRPSSVSIKINRRKCNDISEIGYPNLEPVKWCRSGYYIEERPLFTANPLMHAGVFYVQDASSMIYEEVMERILPSAFDTGRPLRVLDLCAAPGGKTTSIINALPDNALVVANEYIPTRASILKENLIKWGFPNIAVCNSPTSDFAKLDEVFDIVAVDAPCSGEGMMRKDEDALKQWSEGLQRQCANLQKTILDDAVKALKPGGFLIYSTCTFNRYEDEEIVNYIVEELGLTGVDLDFPEQWGIARGIDTEYPCYRFMPHVTRGEGLFLAAFRKEGDYPSAPELNAEQFIKLLKSKVKVIADGIPQTNSKGKLEIPASESVLATDFQSGKYPETELSLNDAIAYLKHEALRLDPEIPKGYAVVKFKGHPLGLVKNIGSRANNLYPVHWKIRMNL